MWLMLEGAFGSFYFLALTKHQNLSIVASIPTSLLAAPDASSDLALQIRAQSDKVTDFLIPKLYNGLTMAHVKNASKIESMS